MGRTGSSFLAKKSLSGLKSSSCTGCPPTQTALRCCAGSTLTPPGRSIYFWSMEKRKWRRRSPKHCGRRGFPPCAGFYRGIRPCSKHDGTGGHPGAREEKAAGKDSPAYQRLWAMGQQLLEVIRRNRGGANKDLGKFADQIKALIDKWDR